MIAVIIMVVAIDQLIWRPLIVWSNKFKIEDTESEYQDRSAVLRYFGRSRVATWLRDRFLALVRRPHVAAPARAVRSPGLISRLSASTPWRALFFIIALGLLAWGAHTMVRLLWASASGNG